MFEKSKGGGVKKTHKTGKISKQLARDGDLGVLGPLAAKKIPFKKG